MLKLFEPPAPESPEYTETSITERLRELDTERAEIDRRLADLPLADWLDPRSLAAADRHQLRYRRTRLEGERAALLRLMPRPV
jgi:hypothetical protein